MYSTTMCLTFSAYILLAVSCVLCDKEDCSATIPCDLPPPCSSEIYCYGQLLYDVQMAKLYNDSKTFVDLELKYPEQVVLANFNPHVNHTCQQYDSIKGHTFIQYETFRSGLEGDPTNEELQQFVDDNFQEGNELEIWTPPDFDDEPALAEKVCNPEYKNLVEQINYIFFNLSRKVKSDVLKNAELYSFTYVPNGFVIPGGRFTELYYWDSFWIVRGLLLLDMPQTAKGVIENLIYLFRTYGIIPNGSRKYYLGRSQPPLLTGMVQEYFRYTKDLDFIRDIIDVLESEFNFWMTNNTVQIRKKGHRHRLARYYAHATGPRPESYREDYATAQNITDKCKKNITYTNLQSAAETGWDFSTRWIIKDCTNKGILSDTKATKIIPVDLNAILHSNAKTIGKFYYLLGNSKKASDFKIRARKLLMGIHSVLWCEDRGIWLDYDIENNISRDYFSASNFAPLWTESYLQTKETLSIRVLAYLKSTKADQFIGGVPTTQVNSTLQWDFPNGWPPLQSIIVEGLEILGTPEAKKEARCLAEKWLQTNLIGFQEYNALFEKYDVTTQGQTGGGGEYNPQTGFGWTNGVCLGFINTYFTC